MKEAVEKVNEQMTDAMRDLKKTDLKPIPSRWEDVQQPLTFKNNQMRTLLKITLMILVSGLWISCHKNIEDLSEPIEGLGGVKMPETDLDRTLYELYTKPYNISVRYRWSAGEMTLSNVVPAEEDKVLQVMNVLKKGWIEPFEEVAGYDFVRTYVPKQYFLIGSYVYLSNGNIVLGSASHGLEITIYGVNQINWTSDAQIRRVLGTIHHELAHVLHQNKMYPAEYELVSAGDYQSSWNSVSTQQARDMGFASPYGSSSPNEDFATLVATLLGGGDEGFEELVATANAEGQRRLRLKETIIANYFMQAYGIDFKKLQASTSRARLLLQGINDELRNEIRPVIEGKFISIMEGSKRASATVNMDSQTFSLTRVDESNQRVTFTSSFSMDDTGLILETPLTFNGTTYTKIEWDSDQQLLYINDNGNRVYFELSDAPTILPITPSYASMITDPALNTSPFLWVRRTRAQTSQAPLAPQYGLFKSEIYDVDIATTAANNNRVYNYFSFNFTELTTTGSSNSGTVQLNVTTSSSGGTSFSALYRYTVNWVNQDEGIFNLTWHSQTSGLAESTLSYSTELREFLTSHTFRIGYVDLPDLDGLPIVGIIRVDDPRYFIVGPVRVN